MVYNSFRHWRCFPYLGCIFSCLLLLLFCPLLLFRRKKGKTVTLYLHRQVRFLLLLLCRDRKSGRSFSRRFFLSLIDLFLSCAYR